MRPRVGFVGVGWIGRNRLDALAATGLVEVAAVADANVDLAGDVARAVGADAVGTDALLDGGHAVDGVVIATPSALHAEHSMRALSSGLAVFCQKPLGRTAAECAAIVDAARSVDRLLGVDLSYRHVAAALAARDAVADGAIGDVVAVDLVFHNAYGPDKAWYRDRALAGGGCVVDLGIHLVDLALWVLDGVKVERTVARLFNDGRPIAGGHAVEDLAMAQLDLSSGAVARLACSWNLHAGCDAVIEATFHGTTGSVQVVNVAGSFYDFAAVLHRGTSSSVLVDGPDDWGGRAAADWALRLGDGRGFDPDVAAIVDVAAVLDGVYEAAR